MRRQKRLRINSYANEVSVCLQYVGQQGQKFDSLARKQNTNGFLKCTQESKTMLDR